MADTLTTATQLLRLADANIAEAFASDLLNEAPLIASMAAAVANASQGTQHKYLKHISAPSVGFRAFNDGLDYTASDQQLVTVDLKTMSANARMDQALAKAHPMGAEYAMDIESMAAIKQAFFETEKQLIYGTNNQAAGFTGISQAATIDALADEMVTNATGATALTSVYLLRYGVEDVELILGNDGNIEVGETIEQLIEGANGKLMPAYVRIQEALVTIKVGAKYSMARIANIGTATGKTLTDALIYDALATFPANKLPSVIAMNRRSLGQLRKSRTATNPTGAPAPIPTEVEGIPIVVTDAIRNDETAVA